MGRARREQAATTNRPPTTTRSYGNVKRQTKVEAPSKVLQAGRAKMIDVSPSTILELSDEAVRRINEARAQAHS
jgi:hypothetical protein